MYNNNVKSYTPASNSIGKNERICCAFCPWIFTCRTDLYEHFQSQHGIDQQFRNDFTVGTDCKCKRFKFDESQNKQTTNEPQPPPSEGQNKRPLDEQINDNYETKLTFAFPKVTENIVPTVTSSPAISPLENNVPMSLSPTNHFDQQIKAIDETQQAFALPKVPANVVPPVTSSAASSGNNVPMSLPNLPTHHIGYISVRESPAASSPTTADMLTGTPRPSEPRHSAYHPFNVGPLPSSSHNVYEPAKQYGNFSGQFYQLFQPWQSTGPDKFGMDFVDKENWRMGNGNIAVDRHRVNFPVHASEMCFTRE